MNVFCGSRQIRPPDAEADVGEKATRVHQNEHGGAHPASGRAARLRIAQGGVLGLPNKLPCKPAGGDDKWRLGTSHQHLPSRQYQRWG
jgi:hypothetical protein